MKANILPKNLELFTKKQLKRAYHVSGSAFFDDPFLKYIFPDEEERSKKIDICFEMIYKLGTQQGVSYTISNNLEGIAIWVPPNTKDPSFWTIMKSLSFNVLFKLGMKMMKNSRPIFDYMEMKHKELVPEDHWYLQHLVVKPEEQGKGYGSLLLKSMFDEIDPQGYPIYVDTNNEKNIKFYERHGFKQAFHDIIPNTTVPLWCGIRNPK